MTLLSNLDQVASSFTAANKLIAKIQNESKQALNPGQYVKENRQETIQALKKELNKLHTERSKILLGEIFEAKERLDKHYQSTRSSGNSFHFLRAERINQAKDTQQAIDTYRRQLNNLTGEERQKYRFAYDDALKEFVARTEPAADYQAEEAINQFRGSIEKDYIADVKMAGEIFENSGTMDAVIEGQLNELEAGEQITGFNWATIVSEIKDNAKHKIYGRSWPDEQAAGMQVNPYDESEPAAAETK